MKCRTKWLNEVKTMKQTAKCSRFPQGNTIFNKISPKHITFSDLDRNETQVSCAFPALHDCLAFPLSSFLFPVKHRLFLAPTLSCGNRIFTFMGIFVSCSQITFFFSLLCLNCDMFFSLKPKQRNANEIQDNLVPSIRRYKSKQIQFWLLLSMKAIVVRIHSAIAGAGLSVCEFWKCTIRFYLTFAFTNDKLFPMIECISMFDLQGALCVTPKL